MKILITGGTGFIGSHLVEAYLAAGHEVTVLDAMFTAHPNSPPKGVEIIREDLTQCDIGKILNERTFDVINHHAAQINVRVSLRDPAYDANHNILATIRLLQAAVMAKRPIGTFLFASSGGAIYGNQEVIPTPEESPTHPESPYGIAKLTCEHYLRFFRRTYGVKTVMLRYANVYGPRQDPSGEAGVISIFANLLLKGEAPTIYGDGAQTRDFIFVKDVARANVLALEHGLDGAYNVGSSNQTTINEIAAKLKSITKSGVQPKYGPPITGELEHSCIAIDKIRQACGWQPMVSLESGLAETVHWIRRVSH